MLKGIHLTDTKLGLNSKHNIKAFHSLTYFLLLSFHTQGIWKHHQSLKIPAPFMILRYAVPSTWISRLFSWHSNADFETWHGCYILSEALLDLVIHCSRCREHLAMLHYIHCHSASLPSPWVSKNRDWCLESLSIYLIKARYIESSQSVFAE